ncbi:hypothetical protein L484_019018 [Morus notabilis]|uniref:Uncharacterized protein n=1 Tax=Morus notabilis TaxID=981085 RepID=W9R249_9ROSA|nr:hypothetical protein L484_019018 [Morus notabilis]
MPRGMIPGAGALNREYTGRMTFFVITTCIVPAMRGLIFGYDIRISGCVTSMNPFLQKSFPWVYRKKGMVNQSTNHNQYS